MNGGIVYPKEGAILACSLKEESLGKAERYNHRIAMIEAGRLSHDPQINAAATRLERNNIAVERAKLSEHVYDSKKIPPPNAPDGWKQLSDEEVKDKKILGLPPGEMYNKDTGFKASVYVSEFEGKKKYVVAFAGTEGFFDRDMVANIRQGAAFETAQYTQAMKIGNQVSRALGPENVEFTGHSLGGGLASAAKIVSDTNKVETKASTFNSAGLSLKTCARQGISPKEFLERTENINAYYSKSDPLSIGQDSVLSLGINKAIGARHPVSITPEHQHSWNELLIPALLSAFEPLLGFSSAILRLAKMGGDGHSIKVMVNNIEHEKTEDANILCKTNVQRIL